MTQLSSIATKAAELRNAFDRERAFPFPSKAADQAENLLAIQVSQEAYAMKVSEISGLVADKKIIAFPSPIAELLGVAGIRGALVPVYSLSALLGHDAEEGQIRWLALCGTEEPLGLGFSTFEAYIQIPQAELFCAGDKEVTRSCVTHVVRATNMLRPVVSIPLIRHTIQELCRSGRVPKEQ